jgi:3-deoxy-D-manno-octulosonic-acid transferase
MRWLAYDLMMRALQPWLRRKLVRRAVNEPLYGEQIEQRFGRYDSPVLPPVDVWVHAVSLGEARAADILLQALRRLRPGLRILLTHGTATGMAQGRLSLMAGDQQAWLPWDTQAAVEGFLEHFQPRLGVLIETEVWPNLTRACAARGVPLMLANARMSERSMQKAMRLSFWSRPAFGALTQVWAQTDADAARLAQLGARRPLTLGNLKFDAQPDAALMAQGHALRQSLDKLLHKPVLLLASSREGEESSWLQALALHAGADRPCVPCVVPRHPQRFDEVAALLQAQGWRVLRRSQWPAGGDAWAQAVGQPNTLLLGDSLGEMSLYYALARVALMGGSFERHGGQNLIEALACGCPVVLGPHTYNFEQVSLDALACGAAARALDMADGVRLGLEVCAQPERQEHMSVQGLAMLSAHQGAAQAMAQALLGQLDQTLTSANR